MHQDICRAKYRHFDDGNVEIVYSFSNLLTIGQNLCKYEISIVVKIVRDRVETWSECVSLSGLLSIAIFCSRALRIRACPATRRRIEEPSPPRATQAPRGPHAGLERKEVEEVMEVEEEVVCAVLTVLSVLHQHPCQQTNPSECDPCVCRTLHLALVSS